MTELMLEMAEEQFTAGKYVEAYYTAKMARQLDPFFPGVDKYAAAFLSHALAAHYLKTRRGEPNWYRILLLPNSASPDSVDHAFCRLGKLLDPENHPSAAAKGAYKLAVHAHDVLGDDSKRRAFRRSIGLPEEEESRPERRNSAVVDDAWSWDHVMTEVLMETAEEHFLAGRKTEAYKTAKQAKQWDPFCLGLDQYTTAYRIHAVAYHYERQGREPNWYQILELTQAASSASIIHSFCRVGKLVDPDKNGVCSAAAKEAYELAAYALETLGDSEAREAFDARLKTAELKGQAKDKGSRLLRRRPCSRNAYRPYDHHRCVPMPMNV